MRSHPGHALRRGMPPFGNGAWSILRGLAIGVALALASAASAATTGSVRGTVVGKGLKTTADMVVSLEAPGLKVTPPAEPGQDRPEGVPVHPARRGDRDVDDYHFVVWSEKLDGLERNVKVEAGRTLSLDLLVEK